MKSEEGKKTKEGGFPSHAMTTEEQKQTKENEGKENPANETKESTK